MKQILLTLSLLLVLPLAVFADSDMDNGIGGKTLSLGVRGVQFTPSDADSGQWNGGLQGRLHMSPGLALEGSIDYQKSTFGSGLVTVKSYPILASLLVYLMPGARWSPFLLGGAGWYYTTVQVPAVPDTTSYLFGTHAGLGLEVMLNDDVSVDGTYRYVWVEDIASKNAAALDKNYHFSGSMVTIALNLLF